MEIQTREELILPSWFQKIFLDSKFVPLSSITASDSQKRSTKVLSHWYSYSLSYTQRNKQHHKIWKFHQHPKTYQSQYQPLIWTRSLTSIWSCPALTPRNLASKEPMFLPSSSCAVDITKAKTILCSSALHGSNHGSRHPSTYLRPYQQGELSRASFPVQQ